MHRTAFARASLLIVMLFLASAIASQSQTFTSMRAFQGTNGSSPWGALIQGLNGNYFGFTTAGGIGYSFGNANYGAGTIFEVSPAGKFTTLYSFCSQVNSGGVCLDGQAPSGMVLAANVQFLWHHLCRRNRQLRHCV